MSKVRIVWLILCLVALPLLAGDEIKAISSLGQNVMPALSNTYWSGTNWVVDNNMAKHTAGATTALTATTPKLEPGKKYLLEYTVAHLSAGQITVAISGATDTARTANGSYAAVITASERSVMTITPDTNFNGAVTAVSVRPYVGGTIYADQGIESAGTLKVAGNTTILGSLTTTGGGIDNVFVACMNGTDDTIDEIVKIVATNGTATNGLYFDDTGDGTITTDIASADGTTSMGGVTTLGARQPDTILNTDGSETLDATMSGKHIVATKSDGATTVTLPAASASTVGVVYYILQTANQNLIVDTTSSENTIIADGSATADTVTISTADHLVGAGMIVIGIRTAASTYMWYVGGLNPDSPIAPSTAS